MKMGVTINRPPRDGKMAFVRSPDLHSIELLQKGDPKPPAEPWLRCRTPAIGKPGLVPPAYKRRRRGNPDYRLVISADAPFPFGASEAPLTTLHARR